MNSTGNELSIEAGERVIEAGIAELLRPQITEAMLNLLAETRILVILGNHGSGKTIQLKQFYEKNRDSSIIYFSAKSKNQTNLAELYISFARQLGYLIEETADSIENLENLPEDILESKFINFLLKASKNSTRYERSIYILIDDFDVLHKSSLINKIYSSPIFSEIKGIKLVLTTNDALDDNIEYATMRLLSFSPVESKELYVGLGLNSGQVGELVNLSQGIPGINTSFIRLIKKGVSPETIISQSVSSIERSFGLEWEILNLESKYWDLLAFILVGGGSLDLEELSLLNNISIQEINHVLKRIDFIDLNLTRPYVSSNSIVSFLENRLSSHYLNAIKILNTYYTETLGIPNGIQRYADHLERFQNKNLIQSIISISNFDQIIREQKDIKIFSGAAKSIAFNQKSRQNWIEMHGFSLLASITHSLSSFSINSNEFNSYLKSSRFDLARDMISRLTLETEKLKYSCLLLNHIQGQGEIIAEQEIEELLAIESAIAEYTDIELALNTGASAYPFSRRLAEKIFAKALGTTAGSQYVEAARSRLSLQLRTDSVNILGKEPEKVNTEEFVRAESSLGMSFSFDDLKREVYAQTETSAALLLIINWCQSNKDDDNLYAGVGLGVDRIEGDAEYIPSIRTLRQLSESFKWQSNKTPDKLLNDIESLSSSVDRYPLQELYRLKININLCRLLKNSNSNDWISLYFDIDSIEDTDTKCLVLSFMIKDYCYLINDSIEFEVIFIDDATKNLDKTFTEMLSNLAEHWEITREIIDNTLAFRPELAIKMGDQLNTYDRRDSAYVNIIVYLSNNIKSINDILLIKEVIEKILNINTAEKIATRAIVNCIDNFMDGQMWLSQIFGLNSKINHPENKIYTEVYKLIYNIKINRLLQIDKCKLIIEKLFDDIDPLWIRVDTAFWVSQALSQFSEEHTQYFLDLARNFSKENIFSNTELAEFYNRFLYMIIRSFEGTSNNKSSYQMMERINRQINTIPSQIHQDTLKSELSLTLRKINKVAEAEAIAESIRQKISKGSDFKRFDLLIASSHALANDNLNDFLAIVQECPITIREECIERALRYNITGISPIELSEIDDNRNAISKEKIYDIIHLIESLSFDANLSYYSEKLVNGILKNSRSHMSGEMLREDVTHRLAKRVLAMIEKIISDKLPDGYNIKHNGYVISLKILAMRINNALTGNGLQLSSFNDLIAEIDNTINNQADKVFLYTSIGDQCRTQDPPLSKKILDSSIIEIQKIPSAMDRADRSHQLAKVYSQATSYDAAKSMIEYSLNYLKGTSYSNRNENTVKNIMQLAYHIDPDYASTLSPLIGNPTDRHIEDIRIKTFDARNSPRALSKVTSLSIREKKFALNILGIELFKGQILGRIPTKNDRDVADYIINYADFSHDISIAAYAWFINNAIKQNKPNEYFEKIINNLTSILDAVITMAETQKEYFRKLVPSGIQLAESANNKVRFFPSGSHEQARDFIVSWIEKNISERLVIYDPFFSSDQLNILRNIDLDSPKQIDIYTLWSAESNLKPGDLNSLRDRYNSNIQQNLRNGIQNSTITIHITGNASGEGPMHDRLIFTNDIGLDITGSLNGIGKDDSKIRVLDIEESNTLFEKYMPGVSTNLGHYYKESRLINRSILFYPD